ncbi:aminotransferase class III-fold pyridoxal phosphate-dependent enzyme [Burkholderiaceae bacterium DAT-1]|nr:aminotransferase class III-fold pyridoxal phosphate-dependent enzyme [Burkholderiaceae bacterium DAT-1]
MIPDDILASYHRHASPAQLEHFCDFVVERAHHATLYCTSGRELIDFASGGFGYAHPAVQTAVIEQIKRAPLSSRILINRGHAELAKTLASWAPGDLEVSYICNSGEEAIDSALKLAKGYWPRRREVVVARGADYGTLSHGTYFAGIGSAYLRSLPFQPHAIHLGDTPALAAAIGSNTAAVLLEPLAFQGKDMQASQAFWQAVRTRCDETGALMIINELRTGLGRTGKRWAIEHTGVTPDVLITGEALGGGHISVGAYLTRQSIHNKVYDRRNPTLHGSTTGANPAACAAASSVLRVMDQENLVAYHTQAGGQIVEALRDQPGITRIQSLGSLVMIDFDTPRRAFELQRQALAQGVLLRQADGPRMRLNIPLIIQPHELEAGVQRLIAALQHCASLTQQTHLEETLA